MTLAQAKYRDAGNKLLSFDALAAADRRGRRGRRISSEARHQLGLCSEGQLQMMRAYGEGMEADRRERERDVAQYGRRALSFYRALGFGISAPAPCARSRGRRAAAPRRRGSRRGTGRRAGPSDSGDPDPAGLAPQPRRCTPQGARHGR